MSELNESSVEETIRSVADSTPPTELEKESILASLRRKIVVEDTGVRSQARHRSRRLAAIVAFGTIPVLAVLVIFVVALREQQDSLSEALGRLATSANTDTAVEGEDVVLYRTLEIFAVNQLSGGVSDLVEEREIWASAFGEIHERLVQQGSVAVSAVYQETLSSIGIGASGDLLGLVERDSVLEGLEIPTDRESLASGLGPAIDATSRREGVDPVIVILQLIRDAGVFGDLRSAAIVSLQAYDVQLLETNQDGSAHFEHVQNDGAVHRFVLSSDGQISSESISIQGEEETANGSGNPTQLLLFYSKPVPTDGTGVAQ
ncbi:hypothetical protein BH23ACT4_BH23ACT4_06240 [soil metagenome]